MAWGKRVRLVVGNGSSEDAKGDAIDLSGLDISFRVLRSVVFGESKSEFTIYNVSRQTQATFMRTDFTDVNFWAGYEDGEYGLIFSGHVLDIQPQWDGASFKITLVAIPIRANGYTEDENKRIQFSSTALENAQAELVAMNRELEVLKSAPAKTRNSVAINNQESAIREKEKTISKLRNEAKTSALTQVVSYQINRETKRISTNTYLSLTYSPMTELRKVIEDVAGAVGFPVTIPNEMGIVLVNGYTANKSLKSILRDIEKFLSTETWGMYVDLKDWVVFNKVKSELSTVDVVAFDSKSGLLGVAPSKRYEYDKDRPQILPPDLTWDIRTVLHPAIAPNKVIQVNTKDLVGMAQLDRFLLVEQVEFSGDNVGGQFVCNIVGSSRNDKKKNVLEGISDIPSPNDVGQA